MKSGDIYRSTAGVRLLIESNGDWMLVSLKSFTTQYKDCVGQLVGNVMSAHKMHNYLLAKKYEKLGDVVNATQIVKHAEPRPKATEAETGCQCPSIDDIADRVIEKITAKATEQSAERDQLEAIGVGSIRKAAGGKLHLLYNGNYWTYSVAFFPKDGNFRVFWPYGVADQQRQDFHDPAAVRDFLLTLDKTTRKRCSDWECRCNPACK